MSSIIDLEAKLDHIFATLNGHRARSIIDLCNHQRLGAPVTKITPAYVNQVLGFTGSVIANWKTNSTAKLGRLLDFAALIGIAPSEERLIALEEAFEQEYGLSPYTDDRSISEMLARWTDDAPARECWLCFAGSYHVIRAHRHLQEMRPSPRRNSATTDQMTLGVSFSAFKDIYDQSSDALTPYLPTLVHWTTGTPRRDDYRARLATPFYQVDTGTTSRTGIATPRPNKGAQKTGSENASHQADSTADFSKIFDCELPTVGQSPAEASEKLALFGGRDPYRSLGYTPLEHVLSNHAFERSVIKTIVDRVNEPTSGAKSYTLRGVAGSGVSIGLAQLVAKLGKDPRNKTYWKIGDPNQTATTLEALSGEYAEVHHKTSKSMEVQSHRIIFVVDDVSRLPPSALRKLIAFKNRCKKINLINGAPFYYFIFGQIGDQDACSEDGLFDLKLTPSDQSACYAKMADDAPAIVRNRTDGLKDMLVDHPEMREIRDDTQAFIDYLLQHGSPTQDALDHWLASVDFASDYERAMTLNVATSQLLDLHVESRTFKHLDLQLSGGRAQPQSSSVSTILRFATKKVEWSGVGLSCARRARSILKRAGGYNDEFLSATFNRLFSISLEKYSENPSSCTEALDYARHILQRLSKSKLYDIQDKQKICRLVVMQNFAAIEACSKTWSPMEAAQWAGTLAAVLPKPLKKAHETAESDSGHGFTDLALLTSRLADRCIKESQLSPEMVLSLLRAMRILGRNSEVADSTKAARNRLAREVEVGNFVKILDKQVKTGAPDVAYRVNETIHAACQFKDMMNAKNSRKQHCFEMTKWFSSVERHIQRQGIVLDAACWVHRARYVWISDNTESARARDFKAYFLRQALGYLKFHPQSQGTWAAEVRSEIDQFLVTNEEFRESLS
jgi:hypothetical protein